MSHQQSIGSLNQIHNQGLPQAQPDANVLPNQPAKVEPSQGALTLRAKIILAVCITAAVLAIGLGLGLGLGLQKPKIDLIPTGPIIQASQSDGEQYAAQQFVLKQDFLIGKDQQVKIILSQARYDDNPNTRRLLQQNSNFTDDYTGTVNFEQMGLTLTFSSDGKLSADIVQDDFQNFLINTEPQTATRLLQSQVTTDQNATIAEITSEISKMFDQNIGVTGSFQFTQTQNVDFIFDNSTASFKLDDGSTQQSTTRRVLTGAPRLLFLKKLFKRAKDTVKTVVKPSVNLVKNNLPLVASTAGGLIKGTTGGAAGTSAFKVAAGVALGTDKVIKQCKNKSRFRVRCPSSIVKNVASNAGVALELKKVCSTSVCGKIKKTLAAKRGLIVNA